MTNINMQQFLSTSSSLSYITDKQLTAVINCDKEAALKTTLGQKIFDCILALFGKDQHGKAINELFKLVHPEGGKEVTYLTPKARFCIQVQAALDLKSLAEKAYSEQSPFADIYDQAMQLAVLFPIDLSQAIVTPIKDMPISFENPYSTHYQAQLDANLLLGEIEEEFLEKVQSGYFDDHEMTLFSLNGSKTTLDDTDLDNVMTEAEIMFIENSYARSILTPLFSEGESLLTEIEKTISEKANEAKTNTEFQAFATERANETKKNALDALHSAESEAFFATYLEGGYHKICSPKER